MKCMHCGSQWTSTQSTTVCPFCNKSLVPDAPAPQTMLDTLIQIQNISGTAAFANGKALLSSFKDLAPTLKKEQTLLAYLEKCGGMAELYAVRDKSPAEQNVAVSRVVCRMTDELLVNEGAARTVCNNYLQALCGKAPVDTAKLEAEKKALEEAKKKAEIAAKRKATLEAKKKAQEEAAKKAQEEAQKKADMIAQLNAQQEAQKKAEEAKKKAAATRQGATNSVKTNASVVHNANSTNATKFTEIMRMFFMPCWVIAAVMVAAATEGFGDDASIFAVPVVIFLMVLGGIAAVNKGSTFVGGITIFGASVIAASFIAIGLEVSDDELSFMCFLTLLVFCCTASAICLALPKKST